MEEIYKELEETKSELESLRKDHQSKSRFAENLKHAHDESLKRLQEARAEIAKNAQEIFAKSEEAAASKKTSQELQSSLRDKDSAVRRLASANESLKSSFAEKVAALEEENRRFASALEEADARSEEQARRLAAREEEAGRLNALLSASQEKLLDAERRARAREELARRDETLAESAREKGELEERLKWRSEQFRHLEDAHGRVQERLGRREREWEAERSDLVDGMCSLQARLDSETRIAEDLRSRLGMCSQALAREEGRRKVLEAQVSESKVLYDNVVSEVEEARSSIASLAAKRDEEIGSLRNSLATKATVAKEMEFRNAYLEEENRELRSSLKELREAQINGADSGGPSFKSLRQRFKSLEQVHRGCVEKLKAKEAESIAETEKLGKELEECLLKLDCRDKQILKLQDEQEACHASLVQQKLEKEEMFVVAMLLQSKFTEFSSKVWESEIEMEECGAQVDERVALLMDQLEKKNSDLVQAQAQIKKERELVESLQARAEHLECIQQEYILMQKKLELYKAGMDESSRNLDRFKEQAVRKEKELSQVVTKAFSDLDRANSAFAEKNSRLSEAEFELQQLKSVVERMEKAKCDLELELKKYNDENLSIRRDLENSLHAKMEAEKALKDGKESFLQITEEKDTKMVDLQHCIVRLEEEKQEFEACALAKLELEQHCEKEKKKFLQFVDDTDRRHQIIQAEVDLLKQIYIQRELEISVRLEEERERFLQVMEEEERAIAEMQQTHSAREQVFIKYVEVGDSEISTLNEALEKIISAYILACQEIQCRNMLISQLEEELAAVQMKLGSEEKQSYGLRNHIHELEVEAKSLADLLENENEKIRVEDELKIHEKTLEVQAEELEAGKKFLHDAIVQLASEKEKWLKEILEFDDLIDKLSNGSEEVMRNWKRVVWKSADDEISMELEVQDLCSSRKANMENCNFPSRTKAGQTPHRRSPLKEYNC